MEKIKIKVQQPKIIIPIKVVVDVITLFGLGLMLAFNAGKVAKK